MTTSDMPPDSCSRGHTIAALWKAELKRCQYKGSFQGNEAVSSQRQASTGLGAGETTDSA